jgi:hypothetical protein
MGAVKMRELASSRGARPGGLGAPGSAGPVAAAILAVAAIAQMFIAGYAVFSAPGPNAASRIMFGGNPFVESPEIGRRVREMTGNGDRIAVVGSEPQIYYHAGRLPATGYLYTYSLVENQPYARAMRDEMIAEIERSRPAVVVFVNTPWSWLVRPGSDLTMFGWVGRYTREQGYSLAGIVEIVSPEQTVSTWGPEAAEYPVRTQNFIEIWRR